MKLKFFRHLHMVNKHRFMVFVLCVKCGIPFRGLVHDLSKYSFCEFFEGVKYYTGTYSPNAKSKEINGYSKAWLHHKGRNKHHIEYWFDNEQNTQPNIPYKFCVECVCDKVAATKCYKGKTYCSGDVLSHWQKYRHKQPTNENMLKFFDKVFFDLKENGDKFVLNKKYLKQTYNLLVLKNNENKFETKED